MRNDILLVAIHYHACYIRFRVPKGIVRSMEQRMNKLVRNGQVAVLYSPDYGAGWSTWANQDVRKDVLFDPGAVELVEQEKWEELEVYITLKYPGFYTGGLRDLQIEWMPEGTQFIVNEYDGNESIQTRDSTDWYTA